MIYFVDYLYITYHIRRGTMLNMKVTSGVIPVSNKYTEDWRVTGIKFKGGEVDPNGQAQAGKHSVSLGLIQTVGCCVIL